MTGHSQPDSLDERSPSPALSRVSSILGSFAMLAPWALLLFQLSTTWETNQQYSHGYVVPLLCLYLLLKANVPPLSSEIGDQSASPFQGKAFLILGIPLALAFAPLWIVRGANSDWRLLNLALYAVVLVLTLAQWYDHGGWKRIRPLLFPLLFFLVAVPWPLATDLRLTQWFQERISSLIVDVLLLLEHEARLEGTVIDVGVFGQIGVDQACSGIHGLQASLVVTLFLGAYFGFKPFKHAVYVLLGIMVALLLNLFRAFALSFVKVKGKGYILDQSFLSLGGWDSPNLHDLAGWIETGLIFLMILLLGRMASRGNRLDAIANEPSNWSNLVSAPPLYLSIPTILIFIGTAIGSELHYRNTESSMEALPTLDLSLEDPEIFTEKNIISQQVAAQLHYKDARSVQWQDRFRLRVGPFGTEIINHNAEYWQAFECNWESGGACTAVLSTHSPESCLPLTGLVQVSPQRGQPPSMLPIKIGTREVLFESYEFARGRENLYVFRCFWPSKILPGKLNLFPTGGYNFKGRIKAAIEGRRNVGGTMLAIAVANVESQSTAVEKLRLHAENKRILLEQ